VHRLPQLQGFALRLLFEHPGPGGKRLGVGRLSACGDIDETEGSRQGRTQEKPVVLPFRVSMPRRARIAFTGTRTLAIAPGRRSGFVGQSFYSCLHRPLFVEESRYAAIRARSLLRLGAPIGSATLGAPNRPRSRRVRVATIRGDASDRAVALVGDRRIFYLATAACKDLLPFAQTHCLGS
jgi:hypothetical protein